MTNDEKLALAMCAGARAIENNKRYVGATYVYDIFGESVGPKELRYYEAAQLLREVGTTTLDRLAEAKEDFA